MDTSPSRDTSIAHGARRFVLDNQHRLLAVYEHAGDAWRPVLVIPEPVH
jgi:hypothetical protein